MADLELSVVMPCLNEEKTVGVCVDKAASTMRRLGVSGEVVVVDNGSTDRSVEIAEAHGARVVHHELKGYGNALRRGFEEARGRYIVMADCDDSYDLTDLGRFLVKLRERKRARHGKSSQGRDQAWGNEVASSLGRQSPSQLVSQCSLSYGRG